MTTVTTSESLHATTEPMQADAVDQVPFAWLTVERALYGLILLLAIGLRFFLLTDQPLNGLEATNAWGAWLVAAGNDLNTEIAPDSPLLHTLYTLSFWLFGAGEVVARAIPALCGVATIWLLWYWRSWFGRLGVLVAVFLLAINPWFTLYSRLADSTALTILLGILSLTALIRLTDFTTVQNSVDEAAPSAIQSTEQAIRIWQQTFAMGLGLLLISGPQMWSWLVVLVAYILLVLPATARDSLLGRPALWVVTGAVAVVGATGFLALPMGLGALSTSLTVWLSQLTGSEESTYTLGWVLIRLLTDNLLIVTFGLMSLFWGWRYQSKSKGLLPFLSVWLLWGVLLLLVPGRGPLALAMVGLPLLLFAAQGLSGLIADAQSDVQWQENSILLLVLAILFVSFTFFLATFSNTQTLDVSLARTLSLILFLGLLLVVAYALWIDGRQARLVIGGGVAAVLMLWTLSSCWSLNHHNGLMHPDGFFATYTNPDVRVLADAVETLSAQRHGDATELPLQVAMDGSPDPVLGWYLRDMRNLSWVLAPGTTETGESPSVVITLPDSTGISGLSTSYLGTTYAVQTHWLPARLTAAEVAFEPAPDSGFLETTQARMGARWTARTRKLWRWIIYHEVETLPPSDEVTLWVATVSGAE